MEWLGSNWVWLALGVGVVAFLAFGRGGCGMGGHEHHQRPKQADRPQDPTPLANQGTLSAEHAGHSGSQQHRHGCC